MSSNESMLVLDIGSSSLRAMLFDRQGKQVPGTRARRTYDVHTSNDGGAELDADEMFDAFVGVVDEVLTRAEGAQIEGVAACSLASNILAVDKDGNALSPAYLYSDTRDSGSVQQLRSLVDWVRIYDRTGCPLHTSYLPARMWWLRQTHTDLFLRTHRWLSLHEFFLNKLFGRSFVSYSLASWTGLLDRYRLDWDDELLDLIGVRREQLSPLVTTKDSTTQLQQTFRSRWKGLARARFFPALGDGAAANVGSGCTNAGSVAVTVGTSGALRAVIPEGRGSEIRHSDNHPPNHDTQVPDSVAPVFRIPQGLWLYHVDERRALLGGSLNNGGNVFSYLRRTMRLPGSMTEDEEMVRLEPDGHGLTLLPFFAGERSPGYHGDARATIIGLRLQSTPKDIVQASLEAIAYRIAAIFDLILAAIPSPHEIVASGSALLNSPVWVQIIADVLGRPVRVSGEEEASARGAALLALEGMGAIKDIEKPAPAFGKTFSPIGANHDVYRRSRERHEMLYSTLVGKG